MSCHVVSCDVIRLLADEIDDEQVCEECGVTGTLVSAARPRPLAGNTRCSRCSCTSSKRGGHAQVLCDGCDAGYHFGCADPVIDPSNEPDNFYCPNCEDMFED